MRRIFLWALCLSIVVPVTASAQKLPDAKQNWVPDILRKYENEQDKLLSSLEQSLPSPQGGGALVNSAPHAGAAPLGITFDFDNGVFYVVDLFSGSTPPLFGPVLLSLGLVGIGGIAAAIASAIPGRDALERGGYVAAGLGGLIVLSALLLAGGAAQGGFDGTEFVHSLGCMVKGLLLSIPVVVWLSIVVRRAAPSRLLRPTTRVACGRGRSRWRCSRTVPRRRIRCCGWGWRCGGSSPWHETRSTGSRAPRRPRTRSDARRWRSASSRR